MSKSLEEINALKAEVERLWALELAARRLAVAAEEKWREALKEYYEQMAQLDLRRYEE